MAEVIDVLFWFWFVLAIGVYLVGNLYDQQLQQKRKKQEQRERARSRAYEREEFASSWSSPASQQSSSYYNNSQQSANEQLGHYQAHNTYNSTLQQPRLYGSDSYSNNYGDQPNLLSYNHDEIRLPSSSYYSPSLDDDLTRRRHSQVGASNLTAAAASIPTATGFSSDSVEWVNGILYLFYTQAEKYGPIISENVQRSLNEKLSNLTSSSSDHSHLSIEFESINQELSTRPELTNVRTESESDKSISATCKIYNKRIVLNLAIRRLSTSTSTTNSNEFRYELVLENLEGKLKSMAMLSDKLLVIQFLEKPDTKILLKPILGDNYAGCVSNLYGDSSGGQSIGKNELISEDVLVQMILQTLTQVVVDLYFGADLDFPQFKASHTSSLSAYKNKLNSMFKGSANELKRQIKQDFFGAISSSSSGERKVFVKLIRANNLNYNQNVTCLMELDAPKQQAVSCTKQGSNPFWDEHFLFNVTDKSHELTFELWDSLNLAPFEQQQQQQQQQLETANSSSLKRNQHLAAKTKTTNSKWPQKSELTSAAKFLGLARVQLDELRSNPVQKVSLALQPIGPPNDLSNSVGGELQLELLFLEHSSSTSVAGAATSASPVADSSASTRLSKSNSLNSLAYQQGDIVSIDRKLTPSGYVITTTTITKQPRQSRLEQQQQQQLLLSVARNQSPGGSSSMATEPSSFDGELHLDTASAHDQQQQQHAIDRRSEGTGGAESAGRLSRPRSRSRSFLRAIRKRFSFSRTRSRSLAGDSSLPHTPTVDSITGRPITPTTSYLEADFESRSRASSDVSGVGVGVGGQQQQLMDKEQVRAKSMPPGSREDSGVPTIVINKSRLSSVDAASAFTFTHPKSQLVIEVLEPTLRPDGNGNETKKGIYKYYAIPDEVASKRKWRKRGTKLHLFNEHQFVACHLAGSSTCHLCGRVFSRRPGKQGYRCRACHLLSHKECHVKVDHNCPYATRDGLQLEFIDADPPASLVEELAAAAAQSSSQSDQYKSRASSSSTLNRAPSSSHGRPTKMRMTAKSISMEADER